MKIVELDIKVVKPFINKEGKPDFKFEDEHRTEVVASTKSQNNLVDELRESGALVGKVEAKDLFMDKNKCEKHLRTMIEEQITDEKLRKSVYNQIVKGLDLACVFEKNSIKAPAPATVSTANKK